MGDSGHVMDRAFQRFGLVGMLFKENIWRPRVNTIDRTGKSLCSLRRGS